MAEHRDGSPDGSHKTARFHRAGSRLRPALSRLVDPVRRTGGAVVRTRTGRVAALSAAGVLLAGSVVGFTVLGSDAEQSPVPTAQAAPALDPRGDRPLTARGQARAVPSPVELLPPRGQAPSASPVPPPTTAPPTPAAQPAQEAAPAAAPPPAVDVPSGCDSYSGNRQIGCSLLSEFGFGLDQMPALDNLWTKESGWNHLASNPSSGAYGIPQSLPGNKMASVGADWETNPATQIRWGLGYIRDRYGDPNGAWAYFQSNGWY